MFVEETTRTVTTVVRKLSKLLYKKNIVDIDPSYISQLYTKETRLQSDSLILGKSVYERIFHGVESEVRYK